MNMILIFIGNVSTEGIQTNQYNRRVHIDIAHETTVIKRQKLQKPQEDVNAGKQYSDKHVTKSEAAASLT